MKKKWMLFIALLGCAVLTSAQEVDVFTVTADVQVKNPPRFGMNYNAGGYSHWTEANLGNQWNRFGSFEPIVMAHWNPVEEGGEDFLVNDKGWALSCWGQLEDGFWDGATLNVFRNNGNGFELLRTDTVLSSKMGKTVVDTLHVPKGPAIQAGDWYYIKNTGLLTFPDHVIDKMYTRNKNPVSHFSKTVNYDGNVQWTLDDQSFCLEGGSTASMKLTLGANAAIYEFTTGGNNPDSHKWDDGEYRWECWMRSDEPVTVTVTFGNDNGPIKQIFDVGSDWKQYTFDFNPKEAFDGYAPITAQHKIRVNKDCSLWLDNWIVFRADQPAFALFPKYKKLLEDYKPGCLRWAAGIGVRTLDMALGDRFAQPTEVEATKAGYGSKMHNMQIPPFLRLCRELDSVPWLILPGMMAPEDWTGLMDYLGGGADTKQGALRIAQGQTEPWTEVFDLIYIEIGNEQWGSNFSHCFNGKPEAYGMMADFQIRRMKESPFYNAEKMKFVVNGWSKQNARGTWTQQAALVCPNADYTDTAHYYGGWDGRTLPGEGDAELFQNRMRYAPHLVETDMIKLLCIDPDLGKNMAGILLADPALLDEVVAAVSSVKKSRNPAQVASFYVDAARDVPVALLVQNMIQQSPEIHAEISALLGLEPDANIGLKGGISSILSIDPQRATQMIQARPEEALKIAHAVNAEPGALADIERIKNGEKPSTPWSVPNALRNGMKKIVAERIGSDPAWISAAEAAIPSMNLTEGRRRLINPAKDIPGVTAASVQGPFLKELGRDAASARALLKKVHEDADDLFVEEAMDASSQLLDGFTTAITKKSPYAYLRIDHLAPSTQIALVDALCETIDQSTATAPKTRNLAQAVLHALIGTDSNRLSALCSDPKFIEEIRQSTSDAIGDSILNTMLSDADIAGAITLAWDKLPKDPARGNKRLVDYEAGPGYPLPGANVKPNPQVERFGKSLALGITTLDAFMYNLSRDFDHQNYYQFGFGNYWTTHNNPKDRFPHPSYQTLMMRNLYCTGNLMHVDNRAVKRHNIPAMTAVHITNSGKAKNIQVPGRKNIPWAMCYAFQEGARHSFILYNRSFSESRTVQLKLPYTPQASAKIVRLEYDDPTANNIEDYKIKIKETEIVDFKNGYTFELKPASAVVIVNEEK